MKLIQNLKKFEPSLDRIILVVIMSDKIESFTCADQFNQIDSSSLPIKYEISPANDEPNCERKIKECEEKCLQKSRRSFLPIGCGLAFYFLLGATEKMPSSYFSPESRKRGLSTFEIGLSPAVDHAMNFLFSFLLMLAIRKRTEKIFCVLGKSKSDCLEFHEKFKCFQSFLL